MAELPNQYFAGVGSPTGRDISPPRTPPAAQQDLLGGTRSGQMPIILLTGLTGCGKQVSGNQGEGGRRPAQTIHSSPPAVAQHPRSEVGHLIAEKLGWEYYDADKRLYTQYYKAIRAGRKLNDEDQLAWLHHVNEVLQRFVRVGGPAVPGWGMEPGRERVMRWQPSLCWRLTG